MGISRQIKQNLRYKLAPYPNLFLPIYRLLAPERNRDLMISKDTEIVIEGFPRSGNTFAVVAFQLSQKRDVKIAHHLHVETQILKGVKQGIPVMVLIRNPSDAVRSLQLRHPNINMAVMLNRYITFYSTVYNLLSQVVVAEFKNVTGNFGKVIAQVNQKFNANFSEFVHAPENENQVFEEIERINLMLYQGNEMYIGRPSRTRQKEYSSMILNLPHPLIDQAIDLYQRVTRVTDLN